MGAVLHWGASYLFCFGIILSMSLSQIYVISFLRSLTVDLTSLPAAAVAEHHKIRFQPFFWSHPVMFEILKYSVMLILLPIYYGSSYLRMWLGLPRLKTMRKRLQGGSSKFGNLVAHINEEFDDCMIEGKIASPASPVAILLLGFLTIALAGSTYAWRQSLRYGSLPFCSLLSFSHLFFIPPLMVIILKDKSHGLKLFASVISFIGAYIFFFPEATNTPDYCFSDTLKAIVISVLSGLLYALYLVYYRLLNPDGWMLKVIGFQALGVCLYGILIIIGLHVTGYESIELPYDRRDILMILYSSISQFCILFCINGALRWGEPLAVGTSVTAALPIGFLFQSAFRHGLPSTHYKVASLILCLISLSIVSAYHLSRAVQGQVILSPGGSYSFNSQPTLDERKRLIVGSDYVI